MELGVLTNLYGNKSLDEVLAHLSKLGVTMAEIGCGGYPGEAHCDPAVLLNDEKAYQEFLDTINGRSLYDFNTILTTDDKVLTLSTCYSDTERTVVHAKLIKREVR